MAHTRPSLLPLQIEKVDLRDEGVYTCAATNLAGESKKDVVLKVLGEDGGRRMVGTRGPSGPPWAGREQGILKT